MPTLEDQREVLKRKIRLDGQTETYPKITDDEIALILEDAQRASFWEASTPYADGDMVQPNVRNGHCYICVKPGTSGTTEPTWPTVVLRQISDGDDLVWRENGIDFKNVYDLRYCLHRVWMLKAEKVAHLHDRRESQTSYSHSQLHEQFLENAKKYAPLLIF